MKTGGNDSQKYLGEKGLVSLIALLSAFVPLSTDLYLPALPGMAKHFGAPISIVNLTLIVFFVFFGAGTLIWGPMSDKYGRRPTLLAGLALYVTGSVLCSVAADIYILILFRALQALGGSAACTIATAMVKDVYEGKKREFILAIVQSMVLISPAVAPVLGALILKYVSWRGAFAALAGIGLLSIVGAAAMAETITTRHEGTMAHSFGRLAAVLANPGFRRLLIIFSLPGISAMAFIASSSYIFVNGFGLSEQAFSGYFSINAIGLILGPALYMLLSGRFARRNIITVCFATTAVSGILMCAIGSSEPLQFIIALLPSSIMGSCMRIPGANLLLEQQREDTGSASSLMICAGILFGSLGMFLISMGWKNPIQVLGIMNVSTGLLCLVPWLFISDKSYIRQIPEN